MCRELPDPVMQHVHRVLTAGALYLREKAPESARNSRDFGRGYGHAIALLEDFRDLLTQDARPDDTATKD